MEPVTEYLGSEGPVTTYRSKGNTITVGGYQEDEEVLSRRNLKFND